MERRSAEVELGGDRDERPQVAQLDRVGAEGHDSVTDRLCGSCTTVMPDRPFPFAPPSPTIRGMGERIESTFVTVDGHLSLPDTSAFASGIVVHVYGPR
jgi:hypothetical protein